MRSPRAHTGIVRLRRELASDPVFGGGSDLRFAPDGRAAAIGVLVAGDKTGVGALDAVRRLRSTEIPRAFGEPTCACSSAATRPTMSTSSTR